MFAVVVVERDSGKVVLARDRLGIKPLYLAETADSTGPFDYHFSRRLLALAAKHGVRHTRDTFRHYRSDAASAVEAGHGHERTHLDGIEAVAELLALYLQTDLTFPEWDVDERGELSDFPSRSVQPTVLEERRDRRSTDAPVGGDAEADRRAPAVRAHSVRP